MPSWVEYSTLTVLVDASLKDTVKFAMCVPLAGSATVAGAIDSSGDGVDGVGPVAVNVPVWLVSPLL